MDRTRLQNLAKMRPQDAKALLGKKRWSAAFYLCGYAVECGLKACILRHLGESGAVFGDAAYLRRLGNCWTHDLVELHKLAGLDAEFGAARGANVVLDTFWSVVKEWKEVSRYEETTEADARALYEAVSHETDGVFRWIRSRW
jgi:HEPN domain-containing protein